jgi:hypothetical protein
LLFVALHVISRLTIIEVILDLVGHLFGFPRCPTVHGNYDKINLILSD